MIESLGDNRRYDTGFHTLTPEQQQILEEIRASQKPYQRERRRVGRSYEWVVPKAGVRLERNGEEE